MAFAGVVEAKIKGVELRLSHPWAIARGLKADGRGGSETCPVVVYEIVDGAGRRGLGEASPSRRYGEDAAGAEEFLRHVDVARLTPMDMEASRDYLEGLGQGNFAAKGAVDMALCDLAAQAARLPLHEYLGLGFREGNHVTSFSIGIDLPELIREKVREAADYPVLKVKLGGPRDKETLAALREVAPSKPIRVDANEAWQTKENALVQIEWLAECAQPLEFVEQPLPAGLDVREHAWLKARSPVPILADESYRDARDLGCCKEGFHGVNVKLIKAGGVTGALAALRAARGEGMKTMIGCMIESSILISAAAHLAELADFLDLDGNLLIAEDPYAGVTAKGGLLSFDSAPEPFGLRVRERE